MSRQSESAAQVLANFPTLLKSGNAKAIAQTVDYLRQHGATYRQLAELAAKNGIDARAFESLMFEADESEAQP